MNWINKLQSPGHLTESVIHYNKAIEYLESKWSMVEVSQCLFNALNKIQTEWVLQEDETKMGEVKAFQMMILKRLDEKGQIALLLSKQTKNLIFLEPRIMNHNTLRRHQYRPDQGIKQHLQKKATEEHRKVVIAYNTFLSQQKNESKETVIKRLAELLYIVRSNIAHGEKTPYGPDLKKIERDEEVCRVIIPLQLYLLNVLLDYSDQKLIAYGTLAPGNVNHSMLSNIRGNWIDCGVNGRIEEINGLPFFHWEIDSPLINAKLFTSEMLKGYWGRLDQFEGPKYKRILIPVNKSHGICIANIYVANRFSETNQWRQ